MSFNGATRAEIVLSVRGEGEGTLDRARMEVARLKDELAKLTEAFKSGAIAPEEYHRTVTKIQTPLNAFTKLVKDLEGAIRTQTAAMGEAISHGNAWGGMIQRSKQVMGEFAGSLNSGRSVYEAARQEMARLQGEIDKVSNAFANGKIAPEEFSRQYNSLTSQLRNFTRVSNEGNAALKEQAAAMGQSRSAAANANTAWAAMLNTGGSIVSTLKNEAHMFNTVGVEVNKIGQSPALKNFYRDIEATNQKIKEQTAAMRQSAASGADWNTVQLTMMNAGGNLSKELEREAHMFQAMGVEAKHIGRTSALMAQMKNETKNASQGMTGLSYAMLHVSHGVQDLQYGWGAFVNNIPLIVTSLGGGPGLAGALMIIGTGINILMPQIKEFARSVGLIDDPGKRAAGTLKDMEDRLKRLQDKPYKLAVDYKAIDDATKQVEILEARIAAAKNAAQARTTLQEESAKIVKDAIVDLGGATDTVSGEQNVHRIMRSAMIDAGGGIEKIFEKDPESPKLKAARERRDSLQKDLDEHRVPEEAMFMHMEELKSSKAEIARIQENFSKRMDTFVESELGGALRGEGASVSFMLDLFDNYEEKFTKGDPAKGMQPVDPLFRLSLEEALPSKVKEARKDKAYYARQKDMHDLNKDLDTKKKREAAQVDQTLDFEQADLDRDNTEYSNRREAAIRHFQTQFHTAMKKEGSLPDAIRRDIAAGKKHDKIMEKHLPKVKKSIENADVLETGWITNDVARGLMTQFIQEVSAQNAAADPNQEVGANEILNAADAKQQAKIAKSLKAEGNRNQAAQRRAARDAKANNEKMLAEDIFNKSFQMTGTQFTPEAAQTAAHHAMQMVQKGHNLNQAAFASMINVLNSIARDQAQANQGWDNIQNGFQNLQAQQMRARQRQPAIIQPFPQQW